MPDPPPPPESQPPEIQAPENDGEPQKFDYAEPAEVFTRAGMVVPAPDAAQPEAGAARTSRRKAITYRRFASGAEAVRYAIEELPPAHLPASVLVLNGDRYEGAAIQALYDSADYPLPRRARARKAPRRRPSE
jgi:hypothetical protein